MLTSVLGFSQTASIQIAHNSPDDAVAVVDVYANGFELMGDLEFRSSSSFTNVPAGVDIEIALAPGSSNSAADAVFTTTVNLTEDENYIIVAGGIISATGYDPAPAFDLEIYPMARLSSAADTITDVLIHHGATDAPTVDIFEIGVGAGLIVDDLSYLDFAGYLELDLDSIDYELEVKNDADSSTIATFPLPLADLGLGGEAITVYASGFLDPSVNSDGPDFGLFATTAAGGPFIEIPLVSVPKALVQIAHNAPDSSLATVDVFADGLEILSDVEFRSATPFLEFLAGVDIEIAIAPGAANDVDSAFYSETINLTDSAVYIMIADGMIDSDYSPFQEFEINTYDLGRIDGLSADTTDILIHHGATDAPTVDVFEVLNCDVDQIHNNVSFGNFAGYYQLPTLDYELEVVNNNSVSYGSYAAPLSTLGLGGQAITVYASGFLDPSTTDTDAPFGLFASTSAGGPFLELPAANVRPSNDEVCNATEILDDASVGVYSNLNAIQTCGEEVITPQGGDCSSSNGWCSQDAVIDNSVWFKFVASTNTAIVSTCAAGNTIDTQIAIFEASDCEDYSTFNLIAQQCRRCC